MDVELISVVELTTILGTSEQVVRRMIRQGLLPVVRVGGGVRIDARKLRQWIDAGGAAYPRAGRSSPEPVDLPDRTLQ